MRKLRVAGKKEKENFYKRVKQNLIGAAPIRS